MKIDLTLSEKTQHKVAFAVAFIAALLLGAEDRLFPLANYHPSSAATATFEWKSMKRDAEDRVTAWAKGRGDLLERAQHTIPNEEAAREVLRLNTLELQYMDLAASAMPMFAEISEDYTKVLALGGETHEHFKDLMADYRALAEVSPKIVQCRDKVQSDNQKLMAGLKDAASSEKVSDALVAMTTGLASLIRSARAGQLAHCGDELIRFEDAYGRLVARHSEMVDVVKEHAKKQEATKTFLHRFWLAVLLFVPWLPEKARKLKEIFA